MIKKRFFLEWDQLAMNVYRTISIFAYTSGWFGKVKPILNTENMQNVLWHEFHNSFLFVCFVGGAFKRIKLPHSIHIYSFAASKNFFTKKFHAKKKDFLV